MTENTEELNGILGEFSPDDFAKQAGESRVQFDAVDYFSEKHIEEAKKIQHTSRAFVRRLSDMQEDQITPTDKIELDRLYEMIVGEDATGSSIGRKLREIKNALNKTDRTFGFYNKYSNEIPKYAQRITGNKAELVKFGKDTMRLIKLPPPSPKGISQFAITPLIAFASLFGSRQGGQTEGSMAAENQAYATPLPQSLEAKPLDDQTKADLAALIYSEAGGKTYQEIEEQARTIYGTIMARAQQTGQAPRDVISTPGQYHGYGNQLYTEYQDGPKNLMNARKAQIIKKVVDELSGRPQPGADNSFFHEGGFGGPLKTHTMSPLTRNPSPTSTPYPYF